MPVQTVKKESIEGRGGFLEKGARATTIPAPVLASDAFARAKPPTAPPSAGITLQPLGFACFLIMFVLGSAHAAGEVGCAGPGVGSLQKSPPRQGETYIDRGGEQEHRANRHEHDGESGLILEMPQAGKEETRR